jgi:hypothetical protein
LTPFLTAGATRSMTATSSGTADVANDDGAAGAQRCAWRMT